MAPTANNPRIYRDWWARHRAQHGFLGALLHCARDLWEFARDSTPARRRARFGDIDFDCDYRVNTTAAGQSWRTRLRALLAGAPYQPSEPALFHEMLTALPIKHDQFTFVDIGSGKGRALLLASHYPFKKIIGVELLPELHNEAVDNIARYYPASQRCSALESHCANARAFDLPPGPLVVYLFNPLPEPDLATFISRLEAALQPHPRPVYLIYHNPLLEPVLARSPKLHKIAGTHQYSIYASTTP
jgi:hypothetical protein